MPVAKSYEGMTIVGEPYGVDKKMYVKVIGPCKRCGGSGHYSMNASGDTTCYRCGGSGKETMEVRWYTESQRASMDKAAEKRKIKQDEAREERRIKWAAHNAFGFGETNKIMVLYGDYETISDWRDEELPDYTVMYNTIFGWYSPAEKYPSIEGKLPKGIGSVIVDWDLVRDETDPENITMKSNEEVKKIVHTLIHGENKSEYQGNVGDWINTNVKIVKNITFDSHYGTTHLHVMEDKDGNVYVWSTASQSLDVDSYYHLKMKVKEHKEYEGVKQTVVFYCKVL